MASSLVRSAPLACGPTTFILSGLVRGVAQGRVPALGQLVPRRADLSTRPARGLVAALVATREAGPPAARHGCRGGPEGQQDRRCDGQPDPHGARSGGGRSRRPGELAGDRVGDGVDRAQRDEDRHGQGTERGQHEDDRGDGPDDAATRRETDDPGCRGAAGHVGDRLAEDVLGLTARPRARREAEQQGGGNEDDEGRALLVEGAGPGAGRGYGRHGRWSPSGRRPAAAATARRAAAALLTVSSYSRCGTESATIPAPAWTCARPSLMSAVRMAMAMSRSPAKSR